MGQLRRPWLDINRILLLTILALQALLIYRSQYGGDRFSEKVLVNDHIVEKPQQRLSSTKTRTKFAMGSMNTQETSYDYTAISNKNHYAAKHGYDMIWSFEPAEGYSKDWDRLHEMTKAITAKHKGENDYEWIWWTDYDLIITNSSVTLESVVEDALSQVDASKRDEIDMIITPDCFPVNSGSLLVRTTPWVLDVIKEWWRMKDIKGKENDDRSLQDCLRDMVADGTKGIDKKSIFVKQWKLNAFPEEIHCHEDDRPWEEGDFVIHFAGAWAHVKDEDPTGVLMRKYAPQAH